MERKNSRNSLYLLTGIAIAGAACWFSTRKGRAVLEGIGAWIERQQKRLSGVQEVLERSRQLVERGRELFEESRDVASQGWRIVKTG